MKCPWERSGSQHFPAITEAFMLALMLACAHRSELHWVKRWKYPPRFQMECCEMFKKALRSLTKELKIFGITILQEAHGQRNYLGDIEKKN